MRGIRNKNEPYIDEMVDMRKRWAVYLIEQCDKIVHNKSQTNIICFSGTVDFKNV